MENSQRLQLMPEEMRALGYRVIDMIVDHLEELPDKPLTGQGKRAEMEDLLREPLPEDGTSAAALLEQVEQDVLGHILHADHPRFFAFVPGPGNFVGAMGDALAAGFNIFGGTWLEASGPTQIELVTVDWLREACGLPPSAGGLFVSGGSVANMTALAVARHIKLGSDFHTGRIYCSGQTHSSIERGMRILGFQPDQLRKLPYDDDFRLQLPALQSAVEEDRAAGLRPFCVVANAGTTNTGSVDPLPELAEYCQREELWFHVDGAYGAAAALCERGRAQLQGLEHADSLALDPHKWLYQPFEIGCVIVREMRWLKQTFHIMPEYLADIEGQEDEINLCDYGIQLTRGSRSLKLWMSFKLFGRSGFQDAIDHGFDLAELVQATLDEMPDWELVTPAQLGIITFRFAPPGLQADELNRLNEELVEAFIADHFAMLTSTVLEGQFVLRMCTINPRTTGKDIRDTLARLDKVGRRLHSDQRLP